MGFNNPSWPWSELEATLSGQPPSSGQQQHSTEPINRDGRAPGSPSWNAGGDSPAWSRKRQPFKTPDGLQRPASDADVVPYAELHCHSNFSFLDGASHPEELAIEAARLGLTALAITDHNGFYGVVRFAEAAKAVGLPTVFGAEITLTDGLLAGLGVARSEPDTDRQVATGRVPDAHAPDPPGTHLLVLADGVEGYGKLSRALSLGHLAGEKGAPQFAFADLAEMLGGHVWVLTGCRKGGVPAALASGQPEAARRELDQLIEGFGQDRVLVELWDHGDPLDSARNDALYELAQQTGVGCVATNNVHYATPAQRKLATALAAVRSRRSLADVDAWLPGSAGAHLRSGTEQQARFARYPGAVERAAAVGRAAAFDLALVAPKLPPFPCPAGAGDQPLTEMQYLRQVTEAGGTKRYGARPTQSEDLSLRSRAWQT
ncbi:MAG: error-prone DNA polymerase, partial [Minisyncoccia bacterium]